MLHSTIKHMHVVFKWVCDYGKLVRIDGVIVVNQIGFVLGVNLRTGQQGIFPSAYAVDMDYNDFDPANAKIKRERYLLGYDISIFNL